MNDHQRKKAVISRHKKSPVGLLLLLILFKYLHGEAVMRRGRF